MGVAIRGWYTVVMKRWMDVFRNNMHADCSNQCSIGTKRHKVCHENIIHTIYITTNWYKEVCFHVVHTKFWTYNSSVAAEIKSHHTGHFYSLLLYMLVSLCKLLIGVALNVLCCRSPSASRYNVLCVYIKYTTHWIYSFQTMLCKP